MNLRSHLLYALLALMPKRQTAVVYTWPAFEDTALALIPELEKTSLKSIYYLAAAEVGGPMPQWGAKVRVLPKRSLRGLVAFLTSRWVFTTHQCYTSVFPKRVESVNLWHGMPIKRIGWMAVKPGIVPRYKVDLATSAFWHPIIRACMRPWGNVLLNGLPRYDRFGALDSVEVRERLGLGAARSAKLVVWLPTYRRAVLGKPVRDGRNFDNVAQFSGFNSITFEQWLRQHNFCCVIKPHPLSPIQERKASDRLLIADNGDLAARGLSLYPLLWAADVLLTDVSSVYVDFLLLDRPVIHAFADRAEYESSRGFTFDWSDEFLAGPWVENMEQLQMELIRLKEGHDAFSARRATLKKLFHEATHESASRSLLGQLWLLESAKSD